MLQVVLILLLCVGTAAGADVYEGESIQAAINNASAGDTITVHAGTYTGNLYVWYPLTLKGENVVLEAKTNETPAIWLWTNDTHIDGFNMSGTWWGTYALGKKNLSIKNCTVSDHRHGIYVAESDNVTVHGNTVSDGEDQGIDIVRSWNVTVSNNVVSDCRYWGGIYVYEGGNVVVNDNIVYTSHDGIMLHQAENTTVSGNICYENIRYGLYLRRSHNNVVHSNQAHNNAVCGVYLYLSTLNTFYNNIWADGGYCYFNDGQNTWNLTRSTRQNIVGGTTSGGNYWGAYTGVDEDGDGIGDTPYDIPGSSDQDMHPLVSPKCGDCDGNGYTSANDVLLAYRKAVDPSYEIPYDWVVDVDGNNYISAADVLEIYRRAVDPNHELHCAIIT